jgi:hypothetical protein
MQTNRFRTHILNHFLDQIFTWEANAPVGINYPRDKYYTTENHLYNPESADITPTLQS